MTARGKFYDLSEIKRISILDVCDQLGIAVEKKGKNLWCKVRNEKTASVILHPENNYFYDFGNQQHGNVIAFVQYAAGKTVSEAIHYLAETFGISPAEGEKSYYEKSMSDWEYAQIGLAGDLASKNITFPIETASFEELTQMSRAYQIPMNKLRKTDPESYEMILKEKAIPYVDALRNQYYCDILNYYEFLTMFDRQVLFFDSEKTNAKFAEKTNKLQRAERILYKASMHTGLTVEGPKKYHPIRILTHYLKEQEERKPLKEKIEEAESIQIQHAANNLKKDRQEVYR